ELLQERDDPRGWIERGLHAREAVLGGARERVVVVVPGLAEARQREPPDVRGPVLDLEAPAPEEVADRVDRPRDVVQGEDPHETAPQQRRQAAGEAARQEPPGGEREREAEPDDAQERAVDR